MISEMLERFDEYLEEHPALENRLEHGALMAAASLPVFAYTGYATLDSFGLPKRFGRIGAWSIGLSLLTGAIWSCLPQAKNKPGDAVEKAVVRQYAKYKGSVVEEITLSLQEYQVNQVYQNRMADIERESDFRVEGFHVMENGQRVPVMSRTHPTDWDWHPGHGRVDPKLMEEYVRNAGGWDNWEDELDDEFREEIEIFDDLDFEDLEPDYLRRDYQKRREYYYDDDNGGLTKVGWLKAFNNNTRGGGSRSAVAEMVDRERRSEREKAIDVLRRTTESGRRLSPKKEVVEDKDMGFGKPKEDEEEVRIAPNSARGMLQRQLKNIIKDMPKDGGSGGTLIKGTVDVGRDPRMSANPTHAVNTSAAMRNISPSITGERDPDFASDVPKPVRVSSIDELMMDDEEDDIEAGLPPILPDEYDPLNELPRFTGVHARGPVSDDDPH